jgi:hypothetical protein
VPELAYKNKDMHLEPRTLSYSESSQGWPSFYSFLADYMIGMNGYFYTWSGGNLYRHNTNDLRNNYYGVQYTSTITGVLNVEPKTIKLFKTMSYESDDMWNCTSLFTDLSSGSMLSTYFVQKEGEWFTFLREIQGTKDFRDRNVNGIGACTDVTGPIGAVVITFAIPVGNMLSIGDYIYSTPLDNTVTPPAATGAPIYVGQVTAVDLVNQTITIDTTVPEPGPGGAAGLPPAVGDYVFFMKDVVSESHGARGYFMQFTLENVNTAAVELFAVGGSVMKSFP